ncbi:MAG: pyridoxamine 5'-phosphate oxidase family protein [Gudongella sp.]|jgi:nitroimidazol reductase NimA-like FMN-containing flavoprotein (pyridoxamine 5'-phosphate oxidase superfamily)|nr:pyridoxamine 5'-phosphate oxidase family protein [Gudongella sp.]
MRRKDREMGVEFGLQVIDRAKFGVVTLVDENGEPYGIPLSIVRDGNTLYFHSAKAGTKNDLFSKEPVVRIVFVGEVEVPELYSEDELNDMVADDVKASELTKTVFTTQYESAIVKGRVHEVTDEDAKFEVLRKICKKFTPDKMAYFEAAANTGIKDTNAFSVEIEELTAKRKRFDSEGIEMKWGRM